MLRKEGTTRGTRGRFELCIGITFRNPTLVTTSPAAGPQRARDAGLGLEVTERVPSDDLVPQPRKQTPTHHTPSVFLFFVWAQGPQRVFYSGAGRAVRGDVVVSHDVTTCHGGMTTQQVLSEGGDGPR